MKIGIDARVLTHSHYTGLKTYAKNLILALLRIDSQNNYIIILAEKIDESFFDKIKQLKGKKFDLYYVKNYFPKLRKITYEQIVLPYLVQKLKLDLLHCLENTGPIFSPAPLVLTVHDLRFFDKEYLKISLPKKYKINDCYQKWLIPLLVRKGAIVICPSKSTAYQVKKIKKNARVKSVYHGINDYWKKIKGVEKEQTFLFITDYSPTKNSERVLRSFRNFIKTISGFKLNIVCSDKLGLEITKGVIEKQEIGKKTKIFYQPSTEKLRLLYNQAQALLLPSTLEGFGLPILEAMACGCPVITSKISSMPEVAGKAALYVNPHSVKDITQKMATIAKSKSLRNSLISRGLENLKRFSWEKAARETIKIYKSSKNG